MKNPILHTSRLRRGFGGQAYFILLISLGLPSVLHAAAPANATELLNNISLYVINPVIFVLFTAAFVVFIWGLVQFVAHLDNEEARSTGAKHMIWGIVGMVVMVGVNSIVDIIQSTVKQIGGD